MHASAPALAVAVVFAAGVLLSASPLIWPRGTISTRPVRTLRPIEALRDRLARAGMGSVTPGVLIAVAVLIGACVGAVGFALAPVPVIALVGGVAAASVPFVLVSARAARAARTDRAVWPDLVDHLVSAVRAGVPLPEALRALAGVGPPRVRVAFARFGTDYDDTASLSFAIDRLKDRLADATADRILETLRMSREIGGSDLVAVLRALSTHLRHDLAVRAEVEARQSWIVNAARVGAAAPWIVLSLLMLRPEAAAAYGDEVGGLLIIAGAGVTVVAYRLMRAAASMPQEHRWFR